MALILREADVAAVIRMPAVVDAVERAMTELGSGAAHNEPRRRAFAPTALMNVMFATFPGAGLMGLKAYSVGSSGIHFLVTAFTLDGHLEALIEADLMGAYRTGAATGAAVRKLRGRGPHRVALIGSGHQARTQAMAIAAAVEVAALTVYSRDQQRREAFAEACAKDFAVPTRAARSAEEAVRDADVVVTMTTAGQPVLEAAWVREGALAVGAGSNFPDRAELPPDLIARSAVVVDQLATARLESGDLIGAEAAGAFDWGRAIELGAVLAGGATAPEGSTVFESHGLAIWDLAAASTVIAEARAAGIGEETDLL